MKGFCRSASSEVSFSPPLQQPILFPYSLLSTCKEKWKKDQGPKENGQQEPYKSTGKNQPQQPKQQ